MVAVLATELPVDPDPLAHRNPACNTNITVTPFRMCGKCQQRLSKQDLNTLPGNFSGQWVAGSFLHCLITLSKVVLNYQLGE